MHVSRRTIFGADMKRMLFVAVYLLPTAVFAAAGASVELQMNKYFIAEPQNGQDRQLWLQELHKYRDNSRSSQVRLDRGIYDRPDLAWAAHAFSCHFTFMYDRSFYDPNTGRYTIDAFLDEGIHEFGGFDAILLWQGYPRLGVDQRNQFDFYKDMPGGLPAVRDIVRQAHQRGVKVFIDYNPWDSGTRREGKPDEAALAELVAAIEADGLFLDTMPGGTSVLRETIDLARPGVVFVPEGHPPTSQLGICNGSWAQGLEEMHTPGLLRLKWIEPRHIQYQIRRWEHSHKAEIETAFFNGSGIMIWENVFGTYNPWPIEDRQNWRRAVVILRHFAGNFTSEDWDPFYPTLVDNLFAHRWPGDKAMVFTLLNRGASHTNSGLLEVPYSKGLVYYDLWNGCEVSTQRAGRNVTIIGSIDRLGCILAIRKSDVDKSLKDLLDAQRQLSRKEFSDAVDSRNLAGSVIEPQSVGKTTPVPRNQPPEGMVYVPGSVVHIQIKHRPREAGCYPDPGTPPDKWPEFLLGSVKEITHDYMADVNGFFIDETEVTNAQFKQFLDAGGYRPRHPENFLKHWPDGQMPFELADHPVVYVDIDDARAYAKWAGKRLPTEPEWHLAAQGTDGRTWPWGNDFDPNKCNITGDRILQVRSCPDGRSPYGCYNMAGNVWEWTESCRDDGHTRFVIIRGGSYFRPRGSDWYLEGGPQSCKHHAKFIRMWPGLDRCATIGFRCVVNAESLDKK